MNIDETRTLRVDRLRGENGSQVRLCESAKVQGGTHIDLLLVLLEDDLAIELLRSREHLVLRRPLDVGQDDSLQRLERLEVRLFADGVERLEDRFLDLLVLAKLVQVARDAERGSELLQVCFVREDDLKWRVAHKISFTVGG